MTTALSVLCVAAVVVGLVGQGWLHLQPTGHDPVRDAVSDYGAGPFARGYQAQVMALAVAAAALAVGFGRHGWVSEVDLTWLWLYAGSRAAIAFAPTDLPGRPRTRTGTVHNLLAVLAFTAIAVAASSIPDDLSAWPAWDGRTALLGGLGEAVMVTAVLTGVCYVLAPLRRWFGLVERALYAGTFGWLAVAALELLRTT